MGSLMIVAALLLSHCAAGLRLPVGANETWENEIPTMLAASHPSAAEKVRQMQEIQRTVEEAHEQQRAAAVTFAGSCPSMPKTPGEWENSYLWGVFIDGKDCQKGPHVYDWDKNFFKQISKTLSRIYQEDDQTELTIETVEHIRMKTYLDKIYTPEGDRAAKGIMPGCTNKMQCDDVRSLLDGIPKAFYSIGRRDGWAGNETGCHRNLNAQTESSKKHLLRNLIQKYNQDVKAELAAGGDKEKLLDKLVAFLRGFAFLHAFQGGNGRLRNMLLQRELRRLGIACATMMYNYNKDAFVDGFPRYRAKVQEGIEMFKRAVEEGKNPWKSHATKDAHIAKFETISGLEKCVTKSGFGSGGTVNLERDEVSPDSLESVTLEELA